MTSLEARPTIHRRRSEDRCTKEGAAREFFLRIPLSHPSASEWVVLEGKFTVR